MTEQGEILPYDMAHMKSVADFLNARKPFNYKSVPVRGAAVWFSEENLERTVTSGDVFDPSELCSCLCDVFVDCGRSVGIVCDYHIDDDELSDYSTIIVPESRYISDSHKSKLLSFAESGGRLIITGPNSCKAFAVVLSGRIADFDGNILYAESKSGSPCFAGTQSAVVFEHCGDELCRCFADKLAPDEKPVSATALTGYGRGQIAFVGWDIISDYHTHHRYAFADVMRDIMDVVDTEPVTYLKSGTNRVELIPATKDGRLMINVINTTEYYHNIFTESYGDIPVICDIEIAVRCETEPEAIMLEPEHREAEFTYDGRYAYVKIDKLHVHTIITVE